MSQAAWTVLTGSFFMVLLIKSVETSRNYGYFNGTSQVRIPNSWNLRTWTQLSFRTCSHSGQLLHQQGVSGETLSVNLHNGSLEFHWRVNSSQSFSRVGNSFSDNEWYTLNLKFYLGTIYFNISKQNSIVFSKVIANSTFRQFLLDVRLSGTNLIVGRNFTGCMVGGPGVNFNLPGVQSTSVVWNASTCPVSAVKGCSRDFDDCWNLPCHNGGKCIDGFGNFTCECLHNFNGTLCEIDLRTFGCDVMPCLNNGTCQPQNVHGSPNYQCSCLDGFTGSDCEININECRQNPCIHGVCSDRINGFHCNCSGTGFDGIRCNSDIDECNTNPCGVGTCNNNPGGFSCSCPDGYDGNGCEMVNECISNPCGHGGTCHDGVGGYNCTCALGYEGVDCEIDKDDCVNATCSGQHSECRDLPNTYECVCKDGFSGTPSDCQDIDECDGNPCKNNATCINLENQYSCNCTAGFEGKDCDKDINECVPEPCQNNGTCYNEINRYRCDCITGFTGHNCSTNINDCAHVVCQNSGSCKDLVNSFECKCTSGWTGTYCETDINECEPMPCRNGGRCHDYINYYHCTCASGYTGFNCTENIDDCDPNPCQHGARCVDRVNDFFCNCTSDWMGKICNQPFSACAEPSPCQNNAACSTVIPSHEYNCTCLSGFDGKNCDNNINDCKNNSCAWYELCKDGINNFTCGCSLGKTGVNCSVEINECDGNPCQNGGTCHDGPGNYTCDCIQSLVNLSRFTPGHETSFLTGYHGVNCELDIDECLNAKACLSGNCHNVNGSYHCFCNGQALITGQNCEIDTTYCQLESGQLEGDVCLNGGICLNTDKTWYCNCSAGYKGKRCEIDIDECESTPCQYNGSCSDLVNGYNCSCIPGITGPDCEININECEPNPCNNSGQCRDKINGFDCNCTDTGFKGPFCDINIDDCGDNSCQHNGTCRDGIKEYTCDCGDAYNGTYCEVDINECASSPCQYNGTCLQRSNRTLYDMNYPGFKNFSYATAAGYLCECIPGIKGKDCEINIDDCENVCMNNATCHDGINTFSCECAAGYKGRLCSEEIDECDLYKPCQHDSSCRDKIADYFCECPPFKKGQTNYGGKNCSVELTGCIGVTACQHGATCVPYLENELQNIHRFTCSCTSGFTGRLCEVNTTMTFSSGAYVMKTDTTEVDLSLQFRTTLTESVLLFYKPGALDYLSLEIHKQKMYAVYGFQSKPDIHMMLNTHSQISDGEWHSVKINLKQNVTLILESSLCTSKEDCTVSFAYPRALDSGIEQLYIGSVPNETWLNSTLSKTSYTGCLQDVILSQEYIILQNNRSTYFDKVTHGCPRDDQCLPYTCNRKGDCLDLWNKFKCNCRRPNLGVKCELEYIHATFYRENLRSWASFVVSDEQRNELKANLDLSLFVRTRQNDSIIMYLGNSNTSAWTYLTLEMKNGGLGGRLVLCSITTPFLLNNFYADGESHFVEIKYVSNILTLSVDKHTANKTISQNSCSLDAKIIFFGGRVPDVTLPSQGRRRRRETINSVAIMQDLANSSYFQGVLQDVQMNNVKLQFFPLNATVPDSLIMNSSSELTEGNVSTRNACDSSPCHQNGTCHNKFYNDFYCDCPYGFRGKDCSELDFCQRVTCPVGARCQSIYDGYECIASATFNGDNSLARYIPTIPDRKTITVISLKLQTEIWYGAFLLIQKGEYFLKLRVAGGNVELNYKLTSEMSSILSVPYPVNDGIQYNIKMEFSNNKIKLQVLNKSGLILQEKNIDDLGSPATNLNNMIYDNASIIVGGVGVDINQPAWEKPFRGCLEEVRIGKILLPFYKDTSFENYTNIDKFSASEIVGVTIGCSSVGSCYLNKCKNGAVCKTTYGGGYKCDCPLGFSGFWCHINIDDCASHDCQHGGRCIDGIGNYTCRCRDGYSGDRCQNNDKDCGNGDRCKNNGSCQNTTSGFTCNCTEDFTGITCNISVNQSCSSTGLCENNGTCSDINVTLSTAVVQSFNCSCLPGYEGPVCEKEVNYCNLLPCLHGGNCTSDSSTRNHTCECPSGYSGHNCETNINDCTPGICRNEGYCIDLVNDFQCNCTEGWKGENCTVNVNECNETQPCQHGTCTDRNGSFSCDCTGTGYNGTSCTEEVNECDVVEPCKNEATCTNTEGNYTCNCTTGYGGHNCDEPSCNHSECLNNSTCKINHTTNTWQCECLPYFEGNACETEGPCVNQNCNYSVNNTERCEQNISLGNFTCICNDGWEGDTCSQDINECERNKTLCTHGNCSNTDGSFFCLCTAGYTGTFCEADINECAGVERCQHKGKCIEGVNNFTCDCFGTNYTGPNCSEDVDECKADPSPCTDNRDCKNTDGGYNCPCKPGYIGEKCLEDPCKKTICRNQGVCNSTYDGSRYTSSCHCPDGFEGVLCEKTGSQTDPDELNIWIIVGPIIAAVLILLIIGVVVFLLLARNKRATRGAYSPSRQETSGSRVELGNVLKKPPEERLI